MELNEINHQTVIIISITMGDGTKLSNKMKLMGLTR